MTVALTTPDAIAFARLCAIRGAVKLEAAGMRHSSGRSMTAHAKRAYGLTGNRARILAQLDALIAARREAAHASTAD